MAQQTKQQKQGMSKQHKEALAKGRQQARAVRNYLEALERDARRGPKLDREQLEKRINDLNQQIEEEENPARRVELIQRRLEYEQRLNATDDEPDMESLEEAFVKAAKEYSERKGITYTAWREAGVPAAVLKRAGIARTRRAASQ